MSFSIRKLFRRAAAAVPSPAAQTLVERGIAAENSGAPAQALQCYRQAIAADPRFAPAHMNLGIALQAGGELAPAIAAYRQALELDPDYAAAHYNLGLARLISGEYARAEADLRSALRLRPAFPEAWVALAEVLEILGRLPEAEAAYRSAIELRPGYHEAHYCLANALRTLDRLPEAEASYRRALEIKPDLHEAHNNLGIVLMSLGRLAQAEASYRHALALKPDFHYAHCNLGNALQALGRPAEAIACYRSALELNPHYLEAHNNLGAALQALGCLSESVACYRRALELKPDYQATHTNLANAMLDLGRIPDAEASYRRALEIKPDFAGAHGNLLFLLNYDPERSAEEIFGAYRQFDERFGLPLRAQWRPHANERSCGRRLRVGYVSPDFRNHSCRHFIEPLLAHHDRAVVEVFAYADVAVEDQVSARMKSHVAHWVPTVGMDDAQLAERIRADGIDILVDLAGHTRGNRLLVFARKPAPVSVSTLGFGYTTGLSAIDWFLSDPFALPEGFEHLFSERPWRLAQCLVYRPAEGMGEVSALPALKNGHVTFGTLTRAVRINQRTVRVWSEILRRVPGARLRIDSSNFKDASLCRSLSEQFALQGVGPDRLEMGFHSPPWDVLREIDIGLDCFPHNSGTTLFESLYMGVPFITLAGRPSVGRLGSSILSKAGHAEWIADSEQAYVDKAAALASELPQLAQIRQQLRPQMQAGALLNEEESARQVEAAYRQMWRQWCAAQ